MDIRYKKDHNEADWRYIRETVFMKEQGFINEFDDIDHDAVHITAYVNGTLVGCIRYYPENEKSCRIGRLAVLKSYRDLHIGSSLLQQAEADISKTYSTIVLDAQSRARAFYEKNGYQVCGKQHMDEHVPHMEMVKHITLLSQK